jgi:peroxiredoxin
VRSIENLNLVLLWTAVCVLAILTTKCVKTLGEVRRSFEPPATLPIGQPAPDFIAETLEGEPITRTTFQGRSAVYVFVRPKCPACHAVIPVLNGLYERARRMNVELVLVSDGTVAELREMSNEMPIRPPIIVSATRRASLFRTYNPNDGTPFFCHVDAQGIVRASHFVGGPGWAELLSAVQAVPA